MITQVKTSPCETTYIVDGIVLKLWAIIGGQLAVSFGDYSFVQHYNQCDKFANTWS